MARSRRPRIDGRRKARYRNAEVDFLKPILPDFDIKEWEKKPWPERLKMACQDWVIQGYGTPMPVYLFYVLKVGFYIWMWTWFCSFTPGMGSLRAIGEWWYAPIAFQKAVLWSMAFEVAGLGCASGPLAGRYNPPFGGIFYFLRPGTIKMPFFKGAPFIGGSKRTWLEALLFAALMVSLVRALIAPELGFSLLLPIAILVPVIGVLDTTVFLTARSEHYYSALICFLFAADWIAGTKWVWAAIWFWAATSKLTRHFPSVIAVMQSTSPMTQYLPFLRKAMFRDFPDDLHPSRLATVMAHVGTVVELALPMVLIASDGGTSTTVALAVMLAFHLFITTSVPLGVPIEWNFMMVYGGFVLFGHYADVSAFSIGSPVLITYLICAVFLLQLAGNLFPSKISFLLSMRYYAGNWAYSVWLFKGNSIEKMDTHIKKPARTTRAQLREVYDEDTVTGVLSKVPVFRAMHIQGRILHSLIPKAVDDIDAYEYADGEAIAGLILGWNMGDGHLHQQRLLEAVQNECRYEEGELRCIFVEAQPIQRPYLAWTIADAKTGVIESGETNVKELLALQPWPG
ncbi:MAG: DUF3556 domain-containing protein [Myxococcales bacterium]|nr:DUF3556 domain-containing protein [Myxococcales bacterium]